MNTTGFNKASSCWQRLCDESPLCSVLPFVVLVGHYAVGFLGKKLAPKASLATFVFAVLWAWWIDKPAAEPVPRATK
jgi:hypothetical protein